MTANAAVFAAILLAIGASIGFLISATMSSRRSYPHPNPAQPLPAQSPPEPPGTQGPPDAGDITPTALGPRILSLLSELPGMALVIDINGKVVLASDEAVKQRLVRFDRLTSSELSDAADVCIQHQKTAVSDMTVIRSPLRRGRMELRVRSIYLEGGFAVLLIADLTEENRLTSVRRDFTANISHELKTPVGAMSLLAEALVAASDDQEAVEHFATRLQAEARRLSRLIRDVIELSRLQGEDPMSDPVAINVASLVSEAIDSVASAAEVKAIHVVLSSGGRDRVVGDEGQLLIALTNLLTNAIAYSEPDTRVAIAVRPAGAFVEIDVKDQGIGIPEAELDRIFERFYRIDAARSRATGGTGLGLAIVRNVCRNHGGAISVWSVEGEGSTFTMKLPIPGSSLLAGVDPQPRSTNRPRPSEQVVLGDPPAGNQRVNDTYDTSNFDPEI